MNRSPASEYIPPTTAAFEFGVSESTLRRLAKSGRIRRYTNARDGRRRLYSRHELQKALTENRPAAA